MPPTIAAARRAFALRGARAQIAAAPAMAREKAAARRTRSALSRSMAASGTRPWPAIAPIPESASESRWSGGSTFALRVHDGLLVARRHRNRRAAVGTVLRRNPPDAARSTFLDVIL